MADSALLLAVVVGISVSVTDVLGGYSCHYRATRYYPYETYTFYKYCQYGCCSSECCTSSQLSLSVGVIIGCVVGGLALTAIIVSVICCCIKRRGQPGRVMRPVVTQGGTSVSTVQHSGSGTAPAGQPHYNYSMQPMGGAFTPGGPYNQTPPPYPGHYPSAYPPSPPPAQGAESSTTSGYDNLAFSPSTQPDSSQPGAGLDNAGYSQLPAPGVKG